MTAKTFSMVETGILFPQGHPAQMLDAVIFDPDFPHLISGYKEIFPHDPWLVGHFPEKPIFPGHCLSECCFLTALALVKITMPQVQGIPMIAQVGKTSFSLPALVWDGINFHLTLLDNLRDRVFVFDAHVTNQHAQTIAKVRGIKGVSNTTIDTP